MSSSISVRVSPTNARFLHAPSPPPPLPSLSQQISSPTFEATLAQTIKKLVSITSVTNEHLFKTPPPSSSAHEAFSSSLIQESSRNLSVHGSRSSSENGKSSLPTKSLSPTERERNVFLTKSVRGRNVMVSSMTASVRFPSNVIQTCSFIYFTLFFIQTSSFRLRLNFLNILRISASNVPSNQLEAQIRLIE